MGEQVFSGTGSGSLAIRKIVVADLKDALREGYSDFMAFPSHAVFLCAIYPLIGLLLAGLFRGLHCFR